MASRRSTRFRNSDALGAVRYGQRAPQEQPRGKAGKRTPENGLNLCVNPGGSRRCLSFPPLLKAIATSGVSHPPHPSTNHHRRAGATSPPTADEDGRSFVGSTRASLDGRPPRKLLPTTEEAGRLANRLIDTRRMRLVDIAPRWPKSLSNPVEFARAYGEWRIQW